VAPECRATPVEETRSGNLLLDFLDFFDVFGSFVVGDFRVDFVYAILLNGIVVIWFVDGAHAASCGAPIVPWDRDARVTRLFERGGGVNLCDANRSRKLFFKPWGPRAGGTLPELA
jgi:hypothetical protein